MFRWDSWLGREADTESGHGRGWTPCQEPEGTGVQQGRVRSALQSWGRGPWTHHEETLRINPPRPARPMLVERSQ